MSLAEVAKSDGVSDIKPLTARAAFASALIAERDGDSAKAEAKLAEAVDRAV